MIMIKNLLMRCNRFVVCHFLKIKKGSLFKGQNFYGQKLQLDFNQKKAQNKI